jgi:hypothetical protein
MLCCAVLLGSNLASATLQAEDLVAARTELDEKFSAELKELASWCDEQKLTREAAKTRTWQLPREQYTRYLVILPDAADPAPAADASESQRQWHERFQTLRRAQADALFALARKTLAQHNVSVTYDLVWETARQNPDHADARRILGYQPHAGRWHTPWEITKFATNQVWHEKYGWLQERDLAKYQAGQRLSKAKKWITAAEDIRIRQAGVEQGWEIITEHYSVKTDHSLEEGVRLAARLERLYRVWQQLFPRYHTSEVQLNQLFQGKQPLRSPTRHQVIFYRTKEEYQRELRPLQPGVEISSGIYLGKQRKAYFFADSEQDDTNLYHEATHQLFSETRERVPNDLGRDANVWIIEGIACYLESLKEVDGVCTVGGVDAQRLLDAHFRLLKDDFYLPLTDLVKYGLEQLQKDPRIPMLYTESAGLTHFLMHYENGRYRDATVDYLTAIYTGRDKPETLSKLTGLRYLDLDRQYREFIQSLPVK